MNQVTMRFFHTEWCPECVLVREKLEELALSYESVIVSDFRPFRKQVYEVSGQYYVPVLVDGDTVLTETQDILAYLDEYPFESHPETLQKSQNQ
jgi:glutathione S-transferase